MTPARRSLLAIASLAGVLLVGTATHAQTALESQVKAAFITKFPAFAAWPPGSFGGGEPLRICLQGEDAVSGALLRTAAGAIGGRPIEVRSMAVADGGLGCHILYAAGSSRQTVTQALQAVRGAPVLTVTDSARGAARGMIHFVVFGERVRFHIDAEQAARGGLSLNSKLLALGLSVKR